MLMNIICARSKAVKAACALSMAATVERARGQRVFRVLQGLYGDYIEFKDIAPKLDNEMDQTMKMK